MQQVGLDEKQNCSKDTRILFCTTGVLLEKIIRSAKTDPFLDYTHIILDEVHERDRDMDFLMILIRKLMTPKIKLILMSATINSKSVTKLTHFDRFSISFNF